MTIVRSSDRHDRLNRYARRMRAATALLLLFLAACSRGDAGAPGPVSPCREQAFEGAHFTVCTPGAGKLMLIAAAKQEAPLRTFAEVGRTVGFDKVSFAMNAGMFDEHGRPIGLAIADGKEKHAVNRRKGGGNFHLMPNGVFIVRKSGKAAIVATNGYTRSDTIETATQSGPMLVIDGKLHPAFEPDGASRLIRNGVGVRSGQALFVISQEPVSFGKFARFFRDAMKTPNALYLDGSVSSLWDPANGRQDAHVSLGPILVVFKPEASTPDP